MPIGIPFLAIELMKNAPRLVESGLKLYDTVSKRQPRQPSEGAPKGEGIPALRAALTEIQEVIDSLDGSDRAQTELITRMAQHQARLVRWVMALTVVAVLSSAAAVAALVIVVVGVRRGGDQQGSPLQGPPGPAPVSSGRVLGVRGA